jgi:SAM-dependent methyltransferase
MTNQVAGLLAEQARYYRERAGEYEDWWFRRGRYDRGADANARWFADAAEVQDALERFRPAGRVLELACGTGLWTRRLVGHADTVTAVDASIAGVHSLHTRTPAFVKVLHGSATMRVWLLVTHDWELNATRRWSARSP